MALKPCEECGKEVSDKAAACPHCGAPIAGSVKPDGEAGDCEPTTVYNPKQDTFLTRNRGGGEALFWLVLIGGGAALLISRCGS